MTEKNPERQSLSDSTSVGEKETDQELIHAEVDFVGTDRTGFGPTAVAGNENIPDRGFEIMVGIPAYNEESSIADVVTAAAAHADKVLVVDDGSQDDTSRQARRAGATVVTHERNRGYGGALGTLFDSAHVAGVDHLVVVDGDGQHDHGDISKLIETQQDTGAEIVIGSRFVDGAHSELPLYRRFGLAVVNILTNFSLRLQYSQLGVSDTQSGFRAYDREVIETLVETNDIGDGMDASLDILFHAARREYEIEEVPTNIDYDIEDSSTQNPITHGLTLVWRIILEVASPLDRRTSSAASVAAVIAVIGAFYFLEITTAEVVVLIGLVVLMGVTVSNITRSYFGSTDS